MQFLVQLIVQAFSTKKSEWSRIDKCVQGKNFKGAPMRCEDSNRGSNIPEVSLSRRSGAGLKSFAKDVDGSAGFVLDVPLGQEQRGLRDSRNSWGNPSARPPKLSPRKLWMQL